MDKVIAVTFESDKIDNQSNVMDLTMRIIDIMGRKISEESIEMADMVLTVPSDGTRTARGRKTRLLLPIRL